MRRCFYTCIFGGYDIIEEPRVKTSGWDYILFTDQEYKSSAWDVRPLYGDPKMMSRDVKMNPHKYLPNYDEWFYFDGTFIPIREIEFTTPYSWLGYEHRVNDPWKEKEKIYACNKGNVDIIEKQLRDYEREGIKRELGHMAGGCLYRKNTANVRKMNDAWWKEFCKYPSRDQISLYKIIHTHAYLVQWNYLDPYVNKINFTFNEHLTKPSKHQTVIRKTAKNPSIYEFTPSGIGPKFRDYGTALNKHCRLVPYDNDWIIIRDQDTMYFPGDHRRIIYEAITKYPDTGIFGAYTNRIGLKWQLNSTSADENTDILYHYKISDERQKKYGSECKEVNKPIAGFFMMFKRSVWEKVKFKEGDFSMYHDALFDWQFSQGVLSLGYKTRLIKGLYLFHFYRFQQQDIRDTKHLFD